MRFYKQPHAFYAGIDLHARSMFTHLAVLRVFARTAYAAGGANFEFGPAKTVSMIVRLTYPTEFGSRCPFVDGGAP